MAYSEQKLLLDLYELKCAEGNNEQGYTCPLTSKPKADRESSLFNWLQRLDPTHPIFIQYPLLKNPPKSRVDYLLFDLSGNKGPVPSIMHLGEAYADFVFESDHLRIDKVYTEVSASHNISPTVFPFAHYTLSFKNTVNEILTIHVFFNTHGSTVGVIAKKSQPASNGVYRVETTVQLNNAVIKKLSVFSQFACVVLKDLMTEKDKQYRQVLEQSIVLDKKLAEALSNFFKDRTEQNASAYIAAGNDFLKAIEEVNFYLESSMDTRGKFVEQMLEKIKNMPVSAELPKAVNEPNVMDKSLIKPKPVNTNVSTVVAQHSSFKPLKTMEELKQMVTAFLKLKKTTATEQISVYQAALTLRDEIIGTWFVENNINNQKTLMKWESLVTRSCDLIEQFKQSACNGDVESVKLLFQHISDQAMSEFYRMFLFNLGLLNERMQMSEEIFQARMQICHFLNTASETYRLVLRCFEYVPCITDTEDRILLSFLGVAIHHADLPLFEMLLEQGLNPHGIATGVAQKRCGLLALSLSMGEVGVPFAKRLIDRGVSMEYVNPLSDKKNYTFDTFRFGALKGEPLFEENKKKIELLSDIQSAFVVMVAFWHQNPMPLEFIQELAGDATFWEFATAAVLLGERAPLSKRTVLTSKNARVCMLEKKEDLEKSIIALTHPECLNFAYVFYPIDETKPKLTAAMKFVIQTLNEQLQTMSPTKLEHLFTQSLTEAESAYQQGHYKHALLLYKTLALVSTMRKKLNHQDRLKHIELFRRMDACVVACPTITTFVVGYYLSVADAMETANPAPTRALGFK